MTRQPEPARGFLFAATDAEYLRLAVRAALSVRAANPGIPVDLATDQPDRHEVFDQVRVLAPQSRRPKLLAMPETRFEQTIYLDADVFALASIEDVFLLLDRFDIAMAQEQFRNSQHAHNIWRHRLFNAFPQYNSGLVAYRSSDPVLAFLRNWRDQATASDARYDQPCLRELLWDSGLRIATLPPEYNLMDFRQLQTQTSKHAAPRILHHPHFHSSPAKGRPAAGSISELLGVTLTRKLRRALARDREAANRAEVALSRFQALRGWWRWSVLKRLKRLW